MLDKTFIFDALKRLAIAKGQDVAPERLQIYCKRLESFKTEQVLHALQILFDKQKFFPDISEILSVIECPIDPEQEAQLLTGSVLDAVQTYGSYRGDDAKAALGALAWLSVERFGGWDALCKLKFNDLGIARAQLKNICKANLRLKDSPSLLETPHTKSTFTRLSELMDDELKQLTNNN